MAKKPTSDRVQMSRAAVDAPALRGAGARSRVSAISATAASPGRSASTTIGRRFGSPSQAIKPSAISGPTTPPAVSAALWNPKARPRAAGEAASAIMASRGAERTPLPMRSRTRAPNTSGQPKARPSTGFASADSR